MRKWLISLAACLAAGAVGLVPDEGRAQTRSHIEKSSNLRLSGATYATLPGLTYDQCEQRCLADSRCAALEHYRGGRVFGREAQCKLFSSVGDTRENRFADIGIKRAGSGPDRGKTATKGAREDEARKQAEGEQRRLEQARQAREAEVQRATRPQEESERARSAPIAPSVSLPPPVAKAPAPAPGAAPPAPPPPSAPAPAARSNGPTIATDRAEPPKALPPPPAAPLPPVASAPPKPVTLPRAPAEEPPVAGGAAPAPAGTPTSESGRPRSRGLTPAAPQTAPSGGRQDSAATPTAGAVSAPEEWDMVPVFYGTDRKRRDQSKRIGYSSDRGSRLELGRAMVTVPKAHKVPNVERPWAITIPYLDITLYQEREDPNKHFTIKELQALSKEAVLQLVRERLGKSDKFKRQAFVLVHGYNNGFDDALYRTAQIAYDLKFDGAPFLYSWPSGSGITSYPYDRDSAQQAEPYLTQFLQMVLTETGAEQVSLIAHSMGNQPLLQVLRYLRQTNPGIASRINQIILAAPDVDRNSFEFLAEQIKGVGKGITMYASGNDVALGISKRFAGGIPRAGDVPEDIGPAVVAGIDTIDVTALSTEYLTLKHSAYAEKDALIRDIEQMIRSGTRPPEKRLPELERVKVERGEYWRYRR